MKDIFPPIETALDMEPEELAPFVLKHLKRIGKINRYNYSIGTNSEIREYAGGHLAEFQKRLMEAFIWLEREMFIAPLPDEQGEWRYITRRGEKILQSEDFAAYAKESLLPSKELHPILVRKVKPIFLRGDYDSYIGSGAWLTNHATGTYTSSTESHWDVTGNWLLDFAGGTDNREFRNLVQDSEGNVTGEFWWLNGINWEYGGTLVGTVSGDTLQLHYDRAPILYTGDFVGTIGNNVITDGTFSDSHGNNLLWTATGTSTQVYDTCTVSDFVKIVAAPADATLEGGYWIAANGTEIGPAIWGSFAIIQEIASDPCGEYGVIDYMSPLRKGLGNWASETE